MPSHRPTHTPNPAHHDRPHTDTAAVTGERRDALGRFYAAHHHELTRIVRAGTRTADALLIEDACSYAWLQLVRRPDITLDRTGLNWLVVVATHEARQLLATARRRLVSDLPGEPAAGFEVTNLKTLDGDPLATTLNHETHRERLQRFGELKPRERRDLFLQAAGYSYPEIAERTQSTYTAVNRRLTEGRRRLLEP